MAATSAELKIGIPKGSLEEATIALFAKSGWKITMRARNYFPEVNDPELVTRLCRPQEIPRYVADGVLDAGLTGKDWTLENQAKVQIVSDLIYSKTSARPAYWVLAVAGDSPYRKPEDLAGKRVATEITGLTERYFKAKNIPVKVEYSWGATEAKVVEGLADAIVEVTETGATIRAHGLRVIDEVLVTNTQFIACPAAWADPWKRGKIEQINLLLQGALKAEGLVGLKMNAKTADVQRIIALLPSLNSPTVSGLRDADWHALEVVVSVAVVRDLIPRLVEAGAEGIIEYPLNKVI
ncbi:MAG: ATP phosphoribosyltransferase [Deltaproteobacteria bacterium]|jgi:ATP phosphoribosyltransferase|nr:ATP phosphoribosyltransferase [Deltaproteobacteria bacterium]